MEGPLHPQKRAAISWKDHDAQTLVFQLTPNQAGYELLAVGDVAAGRLDVTNNAVILRDPTGQVLSQARVTSKGFEVLGRDEKVVLRADKRGSGYLVVAGSGRAIGRTRGNTMNLELPTIGGDTGAIPKPLPPRPGSPIRAEEQLEPIVEIWARTDRKLGELVVQRGEKNLLALAGNMPFKAAVMLGLVEEMSIEQRLTAFAFLVEFK